MSKEKSLRERIYSYLKQCNGAWINGGTFERLAMENGYKASNASRRLRELAEDGMIEREVRKVGKGIASVWYRYIIKSL